VTPLPSRLLTRMQAAHLAGVSKTTVRRAQEDGELAAHPGPDGEHLVDEAELRLWILGRQKRERSRRGPVVDAGAIAALAFERFDLNENPVDVIKAHQLDPDLVERLYAQWSRLRGTLTLSGFEIESFAREMVVLFGVASPREPLRTPAAFRAWNMLVADHAAKLHDAATRLCTRCKRSSPTTCGACVQDVRLAQRLQVEQVRADAALFRSDRPHRPAKAPSSAAMPPRPPGRPPIKIDPELLDDANFDEQGNWKGSTPK
jgi:hypothetical protein